MYRKYVVSWTLKLENKIPQLLEHLIAIDSNSTISGKDVGVPKLPAKLQEEYVYKDYSEYFATKKLAMEKFRELKRSWDLWQASVALVIMDTEN